MALYTALLRESAGLSGRCRTALAGAFLATLAPTGGLVAGAALKACGLFCIYVEPLFCVVPSLERGLSLVSEGVTVSTSSAGNNSSSGNVQQHGAIRQQLLITWPIIQDGQRQHVAVTDGDHQSRQRLTTLHSPYAETILRLVVSFHGKNIPRPLLQDVQVA